MASPSPYQYGGVLLLGLLGAILVLVSVQLGKMVMDCRGVGRAGRLDPIVGLLATVGNKRVVVIHRPVARRPVLRMV